MIRRELKQFLGHGVCETFNRTTTLADPKSAATNDSHVIGDQAWRALKSFHFDPTELRGLGLQVTKLEDVDDGPESQPGQTTLQFKSEAAQRPDRMAAGTSKDAEGADDDNVDYVPPTADEIDLSVLDELPEEIRRELENDMKQRQAQNLGVDLVEGDLDDEVVVILEGPQTANSKSLDPVPPVTPKKPATTTPNISHITRQLRPKTRTIISPARIGLFAKREQKAPLISTDELEELGIDAGVFSALPTDVQREQLNMLRAGATRREGSVSAGIGVGVGVGVGAGHGLGRAHSIESGRRFTRSPSADTVPGRGPARPLVAKFAAAPAIVHTTTKKACGAGSTGTGNKDGDGGLVLLRVTETTEVQAHVRRWVVEGSRAGVGPREGDVRGLEAWTVGCVNMEGTVVGVEKVVQVLRWWRALLRKYWAGEELLREMPGGGRTTGILWWNAFWDVKGAVDAALKEKKFGGKLSLR